MSEETPTSVPAERRIVVGVDGSDCATRALEYAADEADRMDAVLQIVCVCTVAPASGVIVAPNVLDEPGAEEVVRQAIEHVTHRRPGVVTKGEAVFGPVGPILVDISNGAELLVVGTRGHSHVMGVLLGSVSEHVVHHAQCTTTVVR